MGRTLLVAYQNVSDVILAEQCVIDVENGPAGVPEDILDAFVLQCLNDDLGPTELHCIDLPQGTAMARPGRPASGVRAEWKNELVKVLISRFQVNNHNGTIAPEKAPGPRQTAAVIGRSPNRYPTS